METQTLKLSDRMTVEWRDIDGWESTNADAIAGYLMGNAKPTPAMLALVTTKVNVVCGIRSINGTAVNPLDGDTAYRGVAQQLARTEIDKLYELTGEQSSAPKEPEALKNSSTGGQEPQ